MHYLDGLNERQKEAVLHTEGPLLIVAGAGAGKTRVITHRILHLIKRGVAPESILAITFTNKAAQEMQERVRALLAKDRPLSNDQFPRLRRSSRLRSANGQVGGQAIFNFQPPWIGTFHALGVHIIRENSRRLGIPRHFKIFDKGDSLSAVKEAIKRTNRDPRDVEPGIILSAISREKGKMVGLPEFRERAVGEYFPSLVAEVWTEYERILKEEKALDFDDLLLTTARLLQKEKAVREHYGRRFRYIHIDEYQDTNHVQYMIAKLLAETHQDIAVVGDPDQNIYQWRGASIKNILGFEKDYPHTKIVLLEENYRSTQTILTVANRIIEKNEHRKEKILFTRGAEGEKVGLYTAYDEAGEAAFVALRSKQLIESGTPPREIAVLFRANFQSRALEEAFLNAEVPYQVLGTRFFERKEVKDVIAYVRAARTTFVEQNLNGQASSTEGLSDIRRIINVPPRGLGKVTLLKIFAGKEAELPAAMREKLSSFRRLLAELKMKLERAPLSVALKWIVTASGLEAELKKGGTDEEARLENIKELVTFATRYDSPSAVIPAPRPSVASSEGGEARTQNDEVRPELDSPAPLPEGSSRKGEGWERGNDNRMSAVTQFLADVALQSDQDELKEEKNAVRLMTVHASKGLEFEYVFITGLEQDLFPHQRQNADEMDEGAMEEERRLFYVALTRAKKKVFLSYVGVRTLFGARQVNMPSEFIFDIDEEFLTPETIPN